MRNSHEAETQAAFKHDKVGHTSISNILRDDVKLQRVASNRSALDGQAVHTRGTETSAYTGTAAVNPYLVRSP